MAVGSESAGRKPEDFDARSGNLLERLIFNNRLWIVAACVLATVLLGTQAARLTVNASFDRMIPAAHPYIKNFRENQKDLPGLGNSLRIVVENPNGDIFDAKYLEILRDINDTIFLIPGVDRSWMKSLWTPIVRWGEVTEEGARGGAVMPDNFDGSPASIQLLKANVWRGGLVGSLVADNLKSSMIIVPLLEKNPETGQRLDYGEFSRALEEKVRAKHEGQVRIYIVGFAKLVGDLIDGLAQATSYFGLAAAIAVLFLYFHTGCVRGTLLVVGCSAVAVIWQLGLLAALGFELDPYSVLVPFLVFAIGVSHGAQKMNGIMQDVANGMDKYAAARTTFRRLFLGGITALAADAAGFAVLMLIDIPVIRQLALTASLGVAVLVFTNLVLVPVLLSCTGVSGKAALRSRRKHGKTAPALAPVWASLERLTERRRAAIAVCAAAALAAAGFALSLNLKIGDLDPGAPELRPDSRYNRDNAYITRNYGLSSDQFAVLVKTPRDGCGQYKTLVTIDQLASRLQDFEKVQSTLTLPAVIAYIGSASYEGNPKWMAINRDQKILDSSVSMVVSYVSEYAGPECNLTPLIAHLADHKAQTLDRVLGEVERFAKEYDDNDMQFLPAGGSAGIEAVTNLVVQDANRTILLYVYAAVIALCFVALRSWRAVVVAVVPPAITSILCEALMVLLGIGVKVGTLPVIALGVGIGVDYALYLLSVQLAAQRQGLSLSEAYRRALSFTGRVVALAGLTLAAGVVTWVWSPIKFQADMGILLTFMFLWNMVGALVLIPALSHFLIKEQRAAESMAARDASGAPAQAGA